MPDFPDPTLLAIPVFLISVIGEWIAVKTGRGNGRYTTPDALTSMFMGVGSSVVGALSAAASLWLMMLVWPYRLYEMPVTWWSFILLFVLYDLVYYWKHRFAHRIRWFWAEHVTHHSSTHYNLTTALRQPWFGPFTGLIAVGWVLVLMGFHPLYIFFAGGLNLLYQFWIHTELVGRMPRWFEAVMNTPSHHRVHHATNPVYLDRNYAGVFIIWDKMFGSFQAELDGTPCTYGIVKPLNTYNPIIVAFHELFGLLRDCARDGLRPHHWIGRFINPPGWSPDGNHTRSEDIRRAAATTPQTDPVTPEEVSSHA